MKRSWFVLILTTLIGCSSGHLIRESSRSLSDIRAAISKTMLGSPRLVSENGREFYSNYFPRPGRKDVQPFDEKKSVERIYVKMTVLGDRRPYDIRVEAIAEENEDGVYVSKGVDQGLSDLLASELKTNLTKGRDDRNVIDNFKPF